MYCHITIRNPYFSHKEAVKKKSKLNITTTISTCNKNNEDILADINEKYSETIKDVNRKVFSTLICIEFIYIETLNYKNKNGDDTEKRKYKHVFLSDLSFYQYNNGKKVASWDTVVLTKQLKRVYYLCSTYSDPVQVKSVIQYEVILHLCSGEKFFNINK